MEIIHRNKKFILALAGSLLTSGLAFGSQAQTETTAATASPKVHRGACVD